MKFDIIIPSWNQSDLVVQCLKSIREHSRDYRIIFVDNGSDKEEFDIVYEELQKNPHLLIRNLDNMGFVKAVNEGLCVATAPYIVIMNNDTEAVENWLTELAEPLKDNVGASGPRTTTKGSWQGVCKEGVGIEILSKTAMLAFFCTMFRKSVIDNVGLLNEDFGVGLGDDDEYCLRMHHEGYDLALVKHIVIPHHHRSTFKKLYTTEQLQLMQAEAMEKFKRLKLTIADEPPPPPGKPNQSGVTIHKSKRLF